jgi:hypothetical protein
VERSWRVVSAVANQAGARETQRAGGRVTFTSREGQKMSQPLSQVLDFTWRATVDSNHWPSAPENERKGQQD